MYLVTHKPLYRYYGVLHRKCCGYIYYDKLSNISDENRLWKIEGDVKRGGEISLSMEKGYLCREGEKLKVSRLNKTNHTSLWKINVVDSCY